MDTPTQNNRDMYKKILIGFIILLGILIFKEMRPYISGILGACTLYLMLEGQMIYLTEKKRWRRSWASSLLTLEALLFFLIPLTIFTWMILSTLSNVHIDPNLLLNNFNVLIENVEHRTGFQVNINDLVKEIPKIGTNIVQILGQSMYSMAINTLVILFLLYYMLYNYKGFDRGFREILPFKDENKQIIAEETKMIVQANAIGIPMLAFLQGVFAYLGYWMLGVDNALFYGILTGFASVLPLIGTMVVWIPLSIVAVMSGDYTNGLLIALYGFIVIGSVDNIARFLLQKKMADIHPLITIFGVLIGIPLFGFWGVIFGPLLISLFILFFNMYRHEFVSGSHAEPRVTTRYKQKTPKAPTNKQPQKNTEK